MGTLSVPWEPGDYEIRMIRKISSTNYNILAKQDFKVVNTILVGPGSSVAGSSIEVNWTGPKRSGAYVTIAKRGVPADVREGTYFNVTPVSVETDSGSGNLSVPWELGDYEIRMIHKQSPTQMIFRR